MLKRTITAAAILFFASALAGCGQSEPKNQNPNLAAKLFIGSWVENRDISVGYRGVIDEDPKVNGKLTVKDDGTYEFSFVDAKTGQPAENGQSVNGTWKMEGALVLAFTPSANNVSKPELQQMVPNALTQVMKANDPDYPAVKVDQIYCPTDGGGRWYNKQK